jgi:hypothetical protein
LLIKQAGIEQLRKGKTDIVLTKKLLVRCGLLAGLVLSFASLLDICTEACREAHTYTLIGLPMPLWGIGFFITAGVLYELSRVNNLFLTFFLLMISGASGAEIAFILIQKFRIQQWCPLCLGVAGTVYFIAIVLTADTVNGFIKEKTKRRAMAMPFLRKVCIILAVFTLGFFIAYQGMEKGAAEENIPNIFLGKQNSSMEVFIMTDWFCPACEKAEQDIEKAVLDIRKKAKIIFVDLPIHPETLNYTPYNLSFLTYEKNKYPELRKALLALTKRTKEPTPDDVQKAIAHLNVTYKPLSFLAVTKGIQFYDAMAKEFKVSATPTVVIRETKMMKTTKLVGIKEISAVNITKAMDEITHSPSQKQ